MAPFGSTTAVVEWDNGSRTKCPITVTAPTVANAGVQLAVTHTNALTASQPVMPPCVAKLLVPSSLQLAPTPIKLNKLLPFLHTNPNKHDSQILLHGFSYGFRLGYVGPRVGSLARNLASFFDNSSMVRQKVDREVELGRVAGQFSVSPLPALRCSPIGLVPKQVPGEFRLIHNLYSL